MKYYDFPFQFSHSPKIKPVLICCRFIKIFSVCSQNNNRKKKSKKKKTNKRSKTQKPEQSSHHLILSPKWKVICKLCRKKKQHRRIFPRFMRNFTRNNIYFNAFGEEKQRRKNVRLKSTPCSIFLPHAYDLSLLALLMALNTSSTFFFIPRFFVCWYVSDSKIIGT